MCRYGDRVISRRHVVLALGSSALAPRIVAAQIASKMYRVGWLSKAAPATDASPFGVALIRSLDKYGYTLSRNLAFERRGRRKIDQRPAQLYNARMRGNTV